jgi:hypothetical protein
LQALSDAITYRQGMLTKPCRACGATSRCAVHDNDEYLITSYHEHHTAVHQDVQAALDPGDHVAFIQPGDNEPPTVALYNVALMAGLRHKAADGQADPHLQDGPAITVQPPGSSRRAR